MQVTLAADFDGSSQVNAADLAAWKSGFGTTTGAAKSQGDANGDGAVDGGDFLVWQRQAGTTLEAPAAITVPEPAAFVLASLCMLAVAASRHPARARRCWPNASSALATRAAVR